MSKWNLPLYSPTYFDAQDELMPALIRPLPPLRSTAATFEARGGLAALVILQWMWVSERALPSSLAKGTDNRVVTSVQHAHTHTHTHACVQTPTDGDKNPNTGMTPWHVDRQKKTKGGWAADSQWKTTTKPKTRMHLWLKDLHQSD